MSWLFYGQQYYAIRKSTHPFLSNAIAYKLPQNAFTLREPQKILTQHQVPLFFFPTLTPHQEHSDGPQDQGFRLKHCTPLQCNLPEGYADQKNGQEAIVKVVPGEFLPIQPVDSPCPKLKNCDALLTQLIQLTPSRLSDLRHDTLAYPGECALPTTQFGRSTIWRSVRHCGMSVPLPRVRRSVSPMPAERTAADEVDYMIEE